MPDLTFSVPSVAQFDDDIIAVGDNPDVNYTLTFDAGIPLSSNPELEELDTYTDLGASIPQGSPNANTTVEFIVHNAAQLDDAIEAIDSNRAGQLNGNPVPLTNNYAIDVEGQIDPLTVQGVTHDFAAFDNANANVTIQGNDNTLFGDDLVSGFRVLSGTVAVDDFTFEGTVAQGGDGGTGIAGGGGGVDDTYQSAGGGGGMGGVGGDAVVASTADAGYGGGGGGIGIQAAGDSGYNVGQYELGLTTGNPQGNGIAAFESGAGFGAG